MLNPHIQAITGTLVIYQQNSFDDLIVWPDGDYCYLEELHAGEFNWKSDDYRVLSTDSAEWLEFSVEHDLI